MHWSCVNLLINTLPSSHIAVEVSTPGSLKVLVWRITGGLEAVKAKLFLQVWPLLTGQATPDVR